MLTQTEAKLIFSLDRPRPHSVGGKGSIWFAKHESTPLFLPEIFGLERYCAPLGLIELADSDWQRLETVLNARIPNRQRKLLEQAIDHLVSSYCFRSRAPKTSELKERLRKIKHAVDQLLTLCADDPLDIIGKQKTKQRLVSRGTAQHVLSTSQIVNQYLIRALSTEHRSLKKYLQPVEVLGQICDRGSSASQSGREADTGLSHLIATSVSVACRAVKHTNFELPSPNTKSFNLSNYPLLSFVREVVSIGATTGQAAIKGSTGLTSDEVHVASILLSEAKARAKRRSTIDCARDGLSVERRRYR
jgi:hypothetical protein